MQFPSLTTYPSEQQYPSHPSCFSLALDTTPPVLTLSSFVFSDGGSHVRAGFILSEPEIISAFIGYDQTDQVELVVEDDEVFGDIPSELSLRSARIVVSARDDVFNLSQFEFPIAAFHSSATESLEIDIDPHGIDRSRPQSHSPKIDTQPGEVDRPRPRTNRPESQ